MLGGNIRFQDKDHYLRRAILFYWHRAINVKIAFLAFWKWWLERDEIYGPKSE